MHAEHCNRTRWRIWMTRQKRPWLRFHRRLVILQREWSAFGKIGPAVPGSRRDAPQDVARTPYRPAAAIVVAVFRYVELPIRSKRKSERIAQAPCDELRCAAVLAHAQDRTAA